MIAEIAKVIAVVVLLGTAAAFATPKGRLPLAIRGIGRMLGRRADAGAEPVPAWRRIVAFLLALAAAAIAIVA